MENNPIPEPLSENDERLWAALAHASFLLNFVTGFLGLVAPIVIYAVYKDRSRYVAYQSLQAFFFQLLWWVGGGIVIAAAWTISGILSVILIGLLCMPVAVIVTFIPLVAAVYAVYGAVQCYNGVDFKYWLVADWVRI